MSKTKTQMADMEEQRNVEQLAAQGKQLLAARGAAQGTEWTDPGQGATVGNCRIYSHPVTKGFSVYQINRDGSETWIVDRGTILSAERFAERFTADDLARIAEAK